MSFVDLATLALARRTELEDRINSFVTKCDRSINNIMKLKMQAQGFVNQLNCQTTNFKEHFLMCMKTLDEFTYVITDFDLAMNKLNIDAFDTDSSSIMEYMPVQDITYSSTNTRLTTPVNLMDVLSEPMPSTSLMCANSCPTNSKRVRVPKEEQSLISFSSNSCSSESVPADKTDNISEKKLQCEATDNLKKMTLNDSASVAIESHNLPAQTVLQTDQTYPGAIIHVDGETIWILTENPDEVCRLSEDLNKYYMTEENCVCLTPDEVGSLNYCAYFDIETHCYYRVLLVRFTDEKRSKAELFLVDTGEFRIASIGQLQPLIPRFCVKPPYARCCHLSGINLSSLINDSRELLVKQERFMEQYVGVMTTIFVDDNASESLGVYVKVVDQKYTINEMLVQQGLAVYSDRSHSTLKNGSSQPIQGPPELVRERANSDDCPDYEDSYHEAFTDSHSPDIHKNQSHSQDIRKNQFHSQNPRKNQFHSQDIRKIQNNDNLKRSNVPKGQKKQSIDNAETSRSSSHGNTEKGSTRETSGIFENELDITDCPEYEDPLEAVAGYHNRDEADICKHYKGGPEKTCFKKSRCKKKHILHNPDGWTTDQIEVPARLELLPLPAPGTRHKMHVTCVCHFDTVFAQFVTKEIQRKLPDFGVVLPPKTLTDLVRDMNSPATRMSYKPLQVIPAAGELVAALYPLDDQWYRARVTIVSRSDQNVLVMFVDYGNEMWVREDRVRILEPRFMSLPAQAVRCRLAGVVSCSNSSSEWAQAKQTLNDMVLGLKLDVRVIARDFDEITIEMFDEDGQSIAKMLASVAAVKVCDYSIEDDTKLRRKVVVP